MSVTLETYIKSYQAHHGQPCPVSIYLGLQSKLKCPHSLSTSFSSSRGCHGIAKLAERHNLPSMFCGCPSVSSQLEMLETLQLIGIQEFP